MNGTPPLSQSTSSLTGAKPVQPCAESDHATDSAYSGCGMPCMPKRLAVPSLTAGPIYRWIDSLLQVLLASPSRLRSRRATPRESRTDEVRHSPLQLWLSCRPPIGATAAQRRLNAPARESIRSRRRSATHRPQLPLCATAGADGSNVQFVVRITPLVGLGEVWSALCAAPSVASLSTAVYLTVEG